MFKNVSILAVAIALTGCAGAGEKGLVYEKTGEVAGTGGLEVAAQKCAQLEGTRDWQACVAHYDGLYTKSNGAIKRSYVQSSEAPKPTGQVEKCTIRAVWNSSTSSWSYSGCEAGK